ncbi:IS3 family transposase [Thermosipho africanus]|uniref:IS3 family transposase n=1 Tax=Thermosipho africanus TaxID=2421 RepID=UPI001E335129|nr:IS3 family transposase [Thermosipho africanus]
MLKKVIIQSMSRKGTPQDNKPAESFFSHFKEEMVKIYKEKTKEEYIKIHNEERYQARLKNLDLVEYQSHAV